MNFVIRLIRHYIPLMYIPKMPSGITLGRNVHIGAGVKLDTSYGHLISIGDDSTLAPGARILTHDASSNRRTGLTWVAPVTIGKRVFVGADALILPGVELGDECVVAAGAVVTENVGAGLMVAGVPARPIGTTKDLDQRRTQEAGNRFKVFNEEAYNKWPLDSAMLAELDEASAEGGYFFGAAGSGSKT